MPKPQADAPRLPSGGEFSPSQIDLRTVLRIAAEHDADRKAAEEAIRATYFTGAAEAHLDPAERREQQRKRAGNVLIGMRTYGLYDRGRLTDLGRELLASRDDAEMHARFAQHILQRRHGIVVLQAVRDLQARNIEPSKGPLAEEIKRHGIQLARGSTHHQILLLWLGKAAVVTHSDRRYQIDADRAAELAGVALEAVDEWSALTNQQRAVLRVMRNLATVHGAAPQRSQQVIDLVEGEYGKIFGAAGDQLRRQVFDPLEKGGWVVMSQRSGGRGAKSGTIAATKKLLDLDLEALPAAVASEIPHDLRAKLNTPLATIYGDLTATDTHAKGIALELLAIRIATDLNITPRRLRLRGTATAGAEVDLIAEAAHLHFSRWLFQCKNTSRIELADLAKEVGMAVLLRAHVIVIVTTGRVGSAVATYAKSLAQTTALQAVLVDGRLLDRYREKGASALLDFFHITAASTLQLKRSQVEVEAGVSEAKP